jgi:hypothetical protein
LDQILAAIRAVIVRRVEESIATPKKNALVELLRNRWPENLPSDDHWTDHNGFIASANCNEFIESFPDLSSHPCAIGFTTAVRPNATVFTSELLHNLMTLPKGQVPHTRLPDGCQDHNMA